MHYVYFHLYKCTFFNVSLVIEKYLICNYFSVLFVPQPFSGFLSGTSSSSSVSQSAVVREESGDPSREKPSQSTGSWDASVKTNLIHAQVQRYIK